MSVPGDEVRVPAQSGDGRGSRLRFWPLAVVAVALLVFPIWQFASIQLRLSRNGAIAHRLVESLQSRFPGVAFRGTASYESEVIYISVYEHVDVPIRRDVEQRLREEKREQQIIPEIRLRFAGDALDDIKL